jgi:hypothetical protein
VAGALAVVVVGSLAAVHAGGPAHVSASGTMGAPRATGLPAPAPTSTADAAGATSASPQLSTGQSTNSGQFGADAPGSFAVIDAKPTGSSVTVGMGVQVLVVLPTDGSTWGTATVTQGRGTVVTVVSQHQAGGRTDVVLRTHGPGTASVVVPAVGGSSAPWHGTVVVTGP